VFKTDIGTIGLNICYDLYFPELTRLQALQGAQLVVCISASPGLRRRFFEGFCLSRAMENAVYLAYVNRVGIEEGLQFWGGSRVIAPNGSVLAQCKYDVEEFQICTVDLNEVSRARAFIPTIKDLEPGLFDLLRTKSREA
jgi:predicted amidohydrolase